MRPHPIGCGSVPRQEKQYFKGQPKLALHQSAPAVRGFAANRLDREATGRHLTPNTGAPGGPTCFSHIMTE